MNYWLVKSEPYKYSWENFVKDRKTIWDGVRNYQARNNLKAMKKHDEVFFYHSNEGLCIVGIAEVIKEHYPDPTATGEHSWVVVGLKPIKALKRKVTLAEIKASPLLQKIALVKQPRLSVVPINEKEWKTIITQSEL